MLKKMTTHIISHRIKYFLILFLLFSFSMILFGLIMPNYRFFALLLLGGHVVFFAIGYQYIIVPYKRMNETLKRVIHGFSLRDIYNMRYSATPEIESAFSIVKEVIDTKEMVSSSKQHPEYLALQNQINPHFLYNTLESIRGEAIMEGVDSVAEVTETLATFYRYTISNIDQYVTIEDELNHIKDYIAIQQFRFGDKIRLNIKWETMEEKYINYYIPKLVLQPIVENAVFHGIEKKLGTGTITIRFILTPKYVNITISDDGVGMDHKTLEGLNDRLNQRTINYLNQNERKEGGIALINVNSRIQLLFGEDYGINIYSTVDVGTDVEIKLPLMADTDHAQ